MQRLMYSGVVMQNRAMDGNLNGVDLHEKVAEE